VTEEPPDLTTDPGALRVCKRPVAVRVTFARSGGVCETLEGRVHYRAGDAILTGVCGEQWPVRRGLFFAAYAPVPPTEAAEDGLYRKLPKIAYARRLDRSLPVKVGWDDDPLLGRAGDWLLRYEDGTHAVMRDAIFRASYGPAPGETRWPPPP
jgi:hypothetical protein